MTDHLHLLSASEAIAAIRAGSTSPEDLTRACLSRIVERDTSIHAWAFVDPAIATKQARAADPAAPLAGVPIGIKDVILTRDMPTAYNSDAYAGHAPAIDATCVAVLRDAGAVILGKTETVEMASIGRPAPTRNPHALDHTPGGSSSGSAAAVADGHVPIALGTQTGGSIIRPASFCGVWALKPTWGLVSNEGAKQFAPTLDTIGWFARSAGDLGLLLDIFDPDGPTPPPRVPLDGARIGVWRTAGWPRAKAATIQAMTRAITGLEAAGAIVEEIDLPQPFPDLADVHRVVMLAEGRRSFLAEYRRQGDRLHPAMADMVRNAQGYSDSDLRDALDIAAGARIAFDRIAGSCDAILAPSTIAEAPAGLSKTGDLLFNGLFTLLHVPCINIPLFKAKNGLPVGLTLTGPRYGDRKIVAIADAIGRIYGSAQKA